MIENKVLATVNGKAITQRDVDLLLRTIDPKRARQFQNPEGQKHLVEELVNQELYYFEGLNDGLNNEDEFKAELERMTSNLLKQYALNKFLSGVSVEEEEVVKYYDENKDSFKEPESAKASHILVETLEEAQKALDEIANGLAFGDAAMKYSTCPSNMQGGDLGYFTRGRMVPEFEEVAFKLSKDEISEPVKTQFGYHIIKLTDLKKEDIKSLDSIKDQLTQQLVTEKQKDIYMNKTNELKQKYEIVIL